jgi:hypothetical protein
LQVARWYTASPEPQSGQRSTMEKMTERFQFRLTPELKQQIEHTATRRGLTPQDSVRFDVSKECACNGRGVLGWYRGEWIYCTCELGLSYAMDELSKTMQIVAEDLREMPQAESNAREREAKQAIFDRLEAEYNALEAEYIRMVCADEKATQKDAINA